MGVGFINYTLNQATLNQAIQPSQDALCVPMHRLDEKSFFCFVNLMFFHELSDVIELEGQNSLQVWFTHFQDNPLADCL